MRTLLTSTLAGALLFVVGLARAEVTFTKIADQSTAIPGGTGTFTDFAHPAISGGRVMFAAAGAGQQGLYDYENQALGVVVDRHTLVPGTQTYFYEALAPSFAGAHYAFQGYYGQTGVFSSLNGLHAVITTGTVIETPLGPRYVTSVGVPSVAGTDVTTFVNCGDYQAILLSSPGETQVVADTAPGGSFTGVGQPNLGDGFLSFLGYGAFGSGVFRASGTTITPLVTSGDPAPGWDGTFGSFTYLTARGDGIAFLGNSESGMDGRTGVYAYRQGVLGLVADTGTPAPGTGIPFDDFINYGQPSVDSGNVAFAAGASGFAGLYVRYQGQLQSILDTTDMLDGRPLRYVSLGPYGLSGDEVAFFAMFDDLSTGIYVAHIPEPSTMVGGLALIGLVLLKRSAAR
jgi:hypothetical protein